MIARVTTIPPRHGRPFKIVQGDILLAEGETDAAGNVSCEFEPWAPSEKVCLTIGKGIECNVPARVLDGMHIHTKEKPKLSHEELHRRWRRAKAGLPPDTPPEKIAEIALVSGREEKLESLPEIEEEEEG